MKRTTLALSLMALLAISSLQAQEQITLPVIARPAILEEGTQRALSEAQIAELLPWAKDSKVFLSDLLDSVQGLSSLDRNERLVAGIQSVVVESSSKNSELLMRYVLNRGLVINQLLTKEMSEEEVGTIDAKNRVLLSTINMAIKYYEKDMASLSKNVTTPYAEFGIDYFEFLSEINKSIFDASAQYAIQRTSFEWLQWDLYRDLSNTSFASQIVKVNNYLKAYPDKKLSDAQAISYIRQMKNVAQQLKLRETLAHIVNERTLALARNEKERQEAILKQQELLAKQREEEEFRKLGNVIPTIQVIAMPSINNLYFSTKSDVNGVCKSLGFQKALDNTIEKSDGNAFSTGNGIIVDKNGTIINAEEINTSSSAGYGITSLTCVNKVQNRPAYDAQLVTSVKVSDLMISSKSDVNGVCKNLGFNSGLTNSAKISNALGGIGIIFDKDGNPVSSEIIDESNSGGYGIISIICMSKSARKSVAFQLTNISTANFQGMMVSSKSNIDGVCKAFNYPMGGVPNSGVKTDRVRGRGVILDATGSPISSDNIGPEGDAGYQFTSIVCKTRI